MGRKYNLKYKKGKFATSGRTSSGYSKSQKADWARTAWKGLTEDRKLWLSDTRKYDLVGVDDGRSKPNDAFKYKYRSKKRLGKKPGRENKHWRRYYKKGVIYKKR